MAGKQNTNETYIDRIKRLKNEKKITNDQLADMTGIPPSPTLDFRRNPRWGVVDPPNTLEKTQRFDRILLANPYPTPAPMLTKFGVFGSEISEETRLAPSDHLGVYADLDFS